MGDLTCSLQPTGMRLRTRGLEGFQEYGGNAMMKWANGEKIGPVNGEAIRHQERASRAIRNTSPLRFQQVLFAPARCTARFLIHFRPPKKMIYVNKSKASSTCMTGQLLCSLHLVAHSVGRLHLWTTPLDLTLGSRARVSAGSRTDRHPHPLDGHGRIGLRARDADWAGARVLLDSLASLPFRRFAQISRDLGGTDLRAACRHPGNCCSRAGSKMAPGERLDCPMRYNEWMCSEKTHLFRCIDEQSRGPIYVYASRILNSSEDVNDVTQEVFVRLFIAWESLKERDHLLPWFYRLATNLAFDLLRRRKRFPCWELSSHQMTDLQDKGVYKRLEEIKYARNRTLSGQHRI
jgi:hypothetical protein